MNRNLLKKSLVLLCGSVCIAAAVLLAIYTGTVPRTDAGRWPGLIALVPLAAGIVAAVGLWLLYHAGCRRGAGRSGRPGGSCGAGGAGASRCREGACADALLHRIRYHFLFNTLNATACLIKPHPALAEANLGHLSEIFRMMLFQKKKTTLDEEIRMAQRYVEMERLRLGERLRVEWRLDCGETRRIRVPSIILQPLIENAIYHGVETRLAGGTVRIAVTSPGRRLVFDIRNPVAGSVPHHRRGNRVARENIRLRLTQAYGGDFVFDDKQQAQEYRVKINIPLEKDNDKHTDCG